MTIKVDDLMNKNVIVGTPSQTVAHIRTVLSKHKINSLPVVDSEHELLGIVSSSDLISEGSESSPVSQVMTKRVYSIPQYAKIEEAARAMRNHKIHHLIVTHEKKVVGILSSFDLIKLVEEHRYTLKNPSQKKKKNDINKTIRGLPV